MTQSSHHFYDPNMDTDSAYMSGYEDEDSPYPEVRSAVANTDDPSMPCSTLCVGISKLVVHVSIMLNVLRPDELGYWA